MRRLLPFAILLALSAAPSSALAQAPPDKLVCTAEQLATQDPLGDDIDSYGNESVTLTGHGSCEDGSGAPKTAQLEILGTAHTASCLSDPYMSLQGGLTIALTGGPTYSTSISLAFDAAPDGVVATGAHFSTSSGHQGHLAVTFKESTSGPSRCNGGLFHISASGAFYSPYASGVKRACVFESPVIRLWAEYGADPALQGGDGTFSTTNGSGAFAHCGEQTPVVDWRGIYSSPICGYGQLVGPMSIGAIAYEQMTAELLNNVAVLVSTDGRWRGLLDLVPVQPDDPIHTGCWRSNQLVGVVFGG